MKRKRIVVMGFMGSMPIAGVIWQHVHYIVGLQRLGHDVYYIEDSARIPYNAEAGDLTYDYKYAGNVLSKLAADFEFKKPLGVLRPLSTGESDCRPYPKKNPATLPRCR